MKFTLHLGAHKTGTTSFQNQLEAKRAQLRALKQEILLPRDVRKILDKGAIWADPTPARCFFEALLYAHPNAEHLFLSDENVLGVALRFEPFTIYPNALEVLETFAQVFPKRPDMVILTIRNYEGFLPSAYFQFAKRDHFKPINEALRREVFAMERGWLHVVQDILTVFPKTKLQVIPYKNFSPHQGELTKVLFGMKIDTDGTRRRQTPSAKAYLDWLENMEREDAESLPRFSRRGQYGNEAQSFHDYFWGYENLEILRARYVEEVLALRQEGLLYDA